MAASKSSHRNRILKLLKPAELERMEPHLEAVTLSFKEPLLQQGKRIDHIYFPNSGVISLVTDVEGFTVETGTVGREGVLGLGALLGMPQSVGRAFCQIPGDAMRITTRHLQAEIDRGGSLGPVLLRYTNAVLGMLSQNAACNGAHTVEERMCRWLLMTHDRVDADEFALTQEFLGMMLGVRRPTVSLTGSTLQRAGLISYARGRIKILDRARLEAASCECYAFVRDQFELALTDGDSATRQRTSRSR